MKIFGIVLLLTALLFSCRHHTQQDIAKRFQPKFNPKSVTTKISGYGRWPCYFTVYLNSDSTFTYDHACEGKSTSAFGTWHVIGDSVELNPVQKNKNGIAYNVSVSKSSDDPMVIFIVVDKSNMPIENFVILPFNHAVNYKYSEDFMFEEVADAQNFFSKAVNTDSLGVLKIPKRATDSLDFSKLYALTGKKFTIGTRNLPDTIKLRVNINRGSLMQHQIQYEQILTPLHFRYINDTISFKWQKHD